MTEDQERRFRQVCEQAYRRNDMQMLEALRYIRDGATYGRKDQGQWKPRLKEDLPMNNGAMEQKTARHPAKYTDSFIPIFAEKLIGKENVLDIFAGTCKIADIKEHGYAGKIYCNELEPEWAEIGLGKVDSINVGDAEFLPYKDDFFEAICTSPTYGNRMADHFEAKDGSKRNTYRHALGRALDEENTGRMQWGKKYREKHDRIWKEANRVLKPEGMLILNIKNHIRKGEEIDVSGWQKESILRAGFELVEKISVPVTGLGFGANADKRVGHEEIFIFKKKAIQ